MKKSPKVFIAAVLTACAMCAFIFYPFMCANLHLKIYFEDVSSPTDCSLYYTTTEAPSMSEDKVIYAHTRKGKADFILPADLCGKLEKLRLDFTPTDNLICINRVELCSGGFVRKTYDAAQFFDHENIQMTNDLSPLQCTAAIAYIGTDGNDPFITFQPGIVREFREAFSHYTGTKAFLCLFLVAAFVLSRQKIFPVD